MGTIAAHLAPENPGRHLKGKNVISNRKAAGPMNRQNSTLFLTKHETLKKSLGKEKKMNKSRHLTKTFLQIFIIA